MDVIDVSARRWSLVKVQFIRRKLVTYPADNVESSTSVTTKVRTSSDGAMGHDRSGNIRLDEHAVRQGGVGRLILFRGHGVQNRSINSQGAHRRPSRGSSRWRGSRGDTSSRVGILITLSGDASEERAAGGVVGVAVCA